MINYYFKNKSPTKFLRNEMKGEQFMEIAIMFNTDILVHYIQ